MRLDPAFNSQYLHFLGVAYLLAGKYETAAVLFRQRIVMVPETDFTRAVLASALGSSGPDRRGAPRLGRTAKDQSEIFVPRAFCAALAPQGKHRAGCRRPRQSGLGAGLARRLPGRCGHAAPASAMQRALFKPFSHSCHDAARRVTRPGTEPIKRAGSTRRGSRARSARERKPTARSRAPASRATASIRRSRAQ